MTVRIPLLAAMAANGAAGTLFAWSVLLPALGADLGRDPDDLGVVFSAALVAFALAMLLGGRLVDRSGPRRATSVAGLLAGAGLALGAAAPGVATLVLGVGVLFGLGCGLTYLGVVSWASTAHAPGRTTEVALVVAAYAAGPVAAAPVAAVVANEAGWRAALALAAVVVPGAILLGGRGLPVRVAASPVGAPAGRHPDGRHPDDRESSGTAAGPVGDTRALAALWLMFLGGVLPGLLAFAYAVPVATERGLSAATAGLVVSAMAAGNLAGRLLPPVVTGRFGLLPVLWAATAVLAGAVVVLGWWTAPGVVLVGLPVLTLQYGLVSALLPAATRLVTVPARFATAYGRVFSSFGVAGIVGPYLGAVLHRGADGYTDGFRASLLAAGLAAGALGVYQWRLRAWGDVRSRGVPPH